MQFQNDFQKGTFASLPLLSEMSLWLRSRQRFPRAEVPKRRRGSPAGRGGGRLSEERGSSQKGAVGVPPAVPVSCVSMFLAGTYLNQVTTIPLPLACYQSEDPGISIVLESAQSCVVCGAGSVGMSRVEVAPRHLAARQHPSP